MEKEIILPDFLIIPCILIRDKSINRLDREIYGVVYWFKKLKNERCTASNSTISKIVSTSSGSVANSLSRLSKKGYIQIILDTKTNQRLEIVPLIFMNVNSTDHPSPSGQNVRSADIHTPPSSTDEPPLHPQMNPPSSTDEQNKNIKKNNSSTSSSIRRKNNNNKDLEANNTNKSHSKAPNVTHSIIVASARLAYLQNVPVEDIEQLSDKFGFDAKQIRAAAERAYDYLLSKGELDKPKYKDYQAFLRNWLRNNWERQEEKQAAKEDQVYAGLKFDKTPEEVRALLNEDRQKG